MQPNDQSAKGQCHPYCTEIGGCFWLNTLHLACRRLACSLLAFLLHPWPVVPQLQVQVQPLPAGVAQIVVGTGHQLHPLTHQGNLPLPPIVAKCIHLAHCSHSDPHCLALHTFFDLWSFGGDTIKWVFHQCCIKRDVPVVGNSIELMALVAIIGAARYLSQALTATVVARVTPPTVHNWHADVTSDPRTSFAVPSVVSCGLYGSQVSYGKLFVLPVVIDFWW